MSIEVSVYTRQPAMTGSHLRELSGRHDLELRFLDTTGMPLKSTARLDEPLSGQGYVLIGWPVAQAETTAAVERALRERDKPALDRLGRDGKLGWFEFGCREFDFATYEAARRADEEEADEDEEPIPTEVLERLRQAKARYAFRCGTRPRQCGELLETVAALVREATDGFGDE